ncbi:MAG: hypothetical protein J6X89_00910 [Bacteroidales bacterium]|nr:hypothetical protein [Bacteroidales bacterium]
MKRQILFLALALGITVTSCGKMEGQQAQQRDGEVVVNFSLGYQTKATTGINDDAVNTAYVFAFDGNRLDGSAFVSSASTGTINVTPGSRRFIAVINPNSEFTFNSVTTPASLMSMVSQLSSEGIADMVMIGENTVTITSSTTNVSIQVTRLVSKINLSSLKFQLTGALAGKTVSNVAVYLKNYPTSMSYSGTAGNTYTSGLFSANRESFEVYDMLGTMVSGGSAVTGHSFFCYERPTATSSTGSNAIRLCIKGDINGQTYYWSIPVNNGGSWKAGAFSAGDSHYGVKRNHSYSYDITITRAGVPDDGSAPDPEDPNDFGDDDLEDDDDLTLKDMSFTLTVADYITVSEQPITF